MNIQVAVLCDAATNDNDKLSLLGAFERFTRRRCRRCIRSAPWRSASRFFAADEGQRRSTLNFINADGHSIMPNFPTDAGGVRLPEDLHFLTRNFIVNFQNLQFNEGRPLFRGRAVGWQIASASIPLCWSKLISPARWRDFRREPGDEHSNSKTIVRDCLAPSPAF